MKNIKLFIDKLKKMSDFHRVKFAILYGSFSKGTQNKLSDIDIAIFYEGNENERYKFRKKAMGLAPENYDIQMFQDMPLYIQIEILKGKILYFSDEDVLYEIFYNTTRRFEDFKRYYQDYLDRRPEIC